MYILYEEKIEGALDNKEFGRARKPRKLCFISDAGLAAFICL